MAVKKLANKLRKATIKKNFIANADGSCLIEVGNTRVICTASITEGVPRFLKDTGRGWATAEYGMLPASCGSRMTREASKGKVSGRTQEIQRLIGRSLRAVIDFEALGERTIYLDADVIQGDGGTRTASITGCYVAMQLAVRKFMKSGEFPSNPILDHVAAVSVGIVKQKPVLDLCYEEDSAAEVDMNVVMTGSGKFIEVQGTAEGRAFSRKQMNDMLALAEDGIKQLVNLQKKTLK